MYDWFKIFNLTEFLALDLTSKNYVLSLEGIGQKNILVTKGNYTSILYNDVFLCLGMSSNNPFAFEDYAIYKNDETNDVYLGIAVEN